MADWALYLDESGDTEPFSIPVKNGQMPIFSIAGTALPLDRWREYDRAYLALKIQFFQNEIDASSKSAPLWEFKGNRVIAPRNADSVRNRTFAYKVLDLIRDYGGKLFSVTFVKAQKTPMASTSIYTIALQIMAERFDIFLRENNGKGIIVIDSRMAHVTPGRGLDYSVAISYLTFLFGNAAGKQLKNLIEGPMFADSALTAGLQMADIVAPLMYANAYVSHLAPRGGVPESGLLDYTGTRRFWNPMHDLEFRSTKRYSGYQIFGFRTIDRRDWDIPGMPRPGRSPAT